MTRRIAIMLALLCVACGESNDDDTPPPVAQQPVPTTPPTQQVPVPTPPAQLPPSPPQLMGMYELSWIQDPGQVQRPVPASMLNDLGPRCFWARWGWDFAADGGVTVSNELLCEAPPDLGVGHGVCRAEFHTTLQWRQGGFTIGAPVQASSRFVNLRRRGTSGTFDTGTVTCNIRVPAMQATLTDLVPGLRGDRPQEVTMSLADGSRMHLRAVENPTVNFPDLIVGHDG